MLYGGELPVFAARAGMLAALALLAVVLVNILMLLLFLVVMLLQAAEQGAQEARVPGGGCFGACCLWEPSPLRGQQSTLPFQRTELRFDGGEARL